MPASELTNEGGSQRHPGAGSRGQVSEAEIESSGDLHQALLREVNDRIEELNDGWDHLDLDTVLCECGHPDCLEKVKVAADAYERVRRVPTRFLVKPDHVTAGSERIVELADGYVVVEKLGASAATAIRRDPRSTGHRRQEGPR
jgi:hypothetical protein